MKSMPIAEIEFIIFSILTIDEILSWMNEKLDEKSLNN